MGALPDDAVPLPLTAYALVPPLTPFALEHAGLNNTNVGLRTGAGSFVARAYTSPSYADPAAIAYEQRLLAWLAARGLSFAVPVPLPTRGGALCCRGPRGWGALVAQLPGAPLAHRPRDGELLGAALGELHAALRHYPPAPRPGRPLFDTLFRFPGPARDPLTLVPAHLGLPDAPPHDALLRWWREEAARLQDFADGPYRRLPRQVCHNDVTPNNVLVEAGRVTAVLDFEFATPAARALDFATSLRTILPFWEEAEPWAAVRPFCRGYARWMRLTEAEVAALPQLLRLRGAITALWWIGRAAAGDSGPVPDRIANLQALVRWLAHAEQRLVELVMREVVR